jgi:hypothetical protein
MHASADRPSFVSCISAVIAIGLTSFAVPVFAEPAVKLKVTAVIDLSASNPFPFVLEGNATHLGKVSGYGEVQFIPGDAAGSLDGVGPAVLRAANGDLLVGIVTWHVAAEGTGDAHFSWRDAVTLGDGTVVATTGRFLRNRPAGATSTLTSIKDGTSNTIIAILIG